MPNAWERETSQEWFQQVEGWPWERDGSAWVKRGTCPRCGHPMDRTLMGAIKTLDEQSAVMIWCNCTQPHEGRPKDVESGCGQNARITPPTS